ncbi:bifunctional ADP-dependent NAD(P)H-hydrate dehydratase/NAD(P)H-hydrate epimerase [soil metagenome]
MKILSAAQIRSADAYTIKHEPVVSLDLMERAAVACVEWLSNNLSRNYSFKIFCGPGNNGGDGLAIGRLLLSSGFNVKVFVVRESEKYSPDFLENERRLRSLFPSAFHEIKFEKDFPVLTADDCVVDALFGTGLSKPVAGFLSMLIEHINSSHAEIISIDIPSGLFADTHTSSETVIRAKHTLSFQLPKLAFMFAENEKYVGAFHLLNIGLDQHFIFEANANDYYLTGDLLKGFLKPRNKFSHKGNYGHALLVAGIKGKMGAAVLASKACLRTGVGLLSVRVPESGNDIMQISCPEAMSAIGEIDFEKYAAIGIGPGIGIDDEASNTLSQILQHAKCPLVLDADALNIISADKKLLNQVPLNSILTPHPKEFERLFGKTQSDFERHQLQITYSKTHKIFIVLKGAHTCVTTPEGISYFNSTGNPGMAKGGSGDVLTGMITSLLAQGYSSLESSLLGVYLHGLAGDIAADKKGMDGMIARDLVNGIAEAWKTVRS